MSKYRKHGDHDDDHASEAWLVPYADIMTLLLALFIVLYSMSSANAEKFSELSQAFNIALSSGQGVLDMPAVIQKGSDPDDITQGGLGKEDNKDDHEMTEKELQDLMNESQEDLNELKQQIDGYIEQNGLVTSLETELNLSQLLITISDSALFATGEAAVNSEGRKLATAISKMLESYPEYDIVIAGHTDDTPIRNSDFRSNWDLSVMRAVRFMDIMLQNTNLNPERFTPIGHGEYHPVAPNDSPEGKAKNRRVEISIVRSFADTGNQQTIQVTNP